MDWDSLNIPKAIESYEEGIRADERARVVDEYMKYLLAHKKLTREIKSNDIYESVKIEFITDMAGRIKEQTND